MSIMCFEWIVGRHREAIAVPMIEPGYSWRRSVKYTVGRHSNRVSDIRLSVYNSRTLYSTLGHVS
jgi:hypothetical protein